MPMMISICHEYYQALLAQGFCIGIGVGLIFIPGVAVLSTYFTTKLALANGVAAAGSGLAYIWFVLGGTLTFVSLNIPFFYIQYFSIQQGIASGDLAFYLLSIITTGSVFGRVFPNFFANRVGPFNIISACTIVCGGLMFALINLSGLAGIIVIALLYGFFSGAFVSLPPTCFVKLSPDRGLIGTRMGMGYAVMAVGNLIGTPSAGAILQDRGFNAMWVFGGVMSIAGGAAMMMSRNVQGEWKPLARI
ncbi:hypothetical protein ATERTT37_000113 [Aspergillus terreus]